MSEEQLAEMAKTLASEAFNLACRDKETRCRHFNGLQHDKCEAGVCYKTLQADGMVLPCLPWHCDTDKPVAKCEKYGVHTAEEIAEQERQIERSINGTITARKAIVAELDRRRAAGDTNVIAKLHHDRDFSETGCQSAYVAGAGTIPCPVCKTGTLRYSRAACNGHVHAACSTADCVRWME